MIRNESTRSLILSDDNPTSGEISPFAEAPLSDFVFLSLANSSIPWL